MTAIEICSPSGFAEDPGKYELENYSFERATAEQMAEYRRLVHAVYEPLGFLNDQAECFLPREGTTCYVLLYRDRIVGSCALTPVADADSVYHRHIPDGARDGQQAMVELNNIILIPELRGGIGLALILYNCVLTAIAEGSSLVVGITRYQTLRYFVEAGAIPIAHEPLHLLGREDLNDFIIYYDIRSEDARTYIRERARRLFGQASVLSDIRRRLETRGNRRRNGTHPDGLAPCPEAGVIATAAGATAAGAAAA